MRALRAVWGWLRLWISALWRAVGRWVGMAKTILQRDTEGSPEQAFVVPDTIQNADGSVSAVASDAGLFLSAANDNVQISVLPDGAITIESTSGTTVTLAADGTVQVQAGGMVEIAPGNTFDTDGAVSLAAGVVTVAPDGAVGIGPTRITVAANGDLDIGPGNFVMDANGDLDINSGTLVVAGDSSAFTVNAGAVSLNLPTVDPAVAGVAWNNNGVVMVSAG